MLKFGINNQKVGSVKPDVWYALFHEYLNPTDSTSKAVRELYEYDGTSEDGLIIEILEDYKNGKINLNGFNLSGYVHQKLEYETLAKQQAKKTNKTVSINTSDDEDDGSYNPNEVSEEDIYKHTNHGKDAYDKLIDDMALEETIAEMKSYNEKLKAKEGVEVLYLIYRQVACHDQSRIGKLKGIVNRHPEVAECMHELLTSGYSFGELFPEYVDRYESESVEATLPPKVEDIASSNLVADTIEYDISMVKQMLTQQDDTNVYAIKQIIEYVINDDRIEVLAEELSEECEGARETRKDITKIANDIKAIKQSLNLKSSSYDNDMNKIKNLEIEKASLTDTVPVDLLRTGMKQLKSQNFRENILTNRIYVDELKDNELLANLDSNLVTLIPVVLFEKIHNLKLFSECSA